MLLFALLLACGDKGGAGDDGAEPPGDTADMGEEPAPSEEICDGVDNDGDGSIDEGVGSTWYFDGDGDGFGRADLTLTACEAPAGYAAEAGDCDDSAPSISPAAVEACDGVDDDCDGTADEGVTSTFYADPDGDGYGDEGAPTEGCGFVAGYVADDDDCDSADAAVHPGAAELCDGIDNDCDLLLDGWDDDAVGAQTHFLDADGDGYGTYASAWSTCDPPADYVPTPGDCDDADAAVNPGAAEVCDGADTDCDGAGDSALLETFYLDDDGDGYGDAAASLVGCEAPAGYAALDGDCDHADAAVNPGAAEVCNGQDDDCDGAADDGMSTFYADDDGDGFGGLAASLAGCEPPAGYVGVDGDCDDADPAVYPGASGGCMDLDYDCDGSVIASQGFVTFTAEDGTVTDLTADLAAGTADSPAQITLSDPGTLSFCEGAWFAQITVAADVSFVGLFGSGYSTLDGAAGTAVDVADGMAFSLEGLTVANADVGLSLGSGGVTVTDSAFQGNGLGEHLDEVAGAIWAEGADLVIAGATFDGGSAGLHLDGGSLAITDSSFAGIGGHLSGYDETRYDQNALHASGADVWLSGVTFSDNGDGAAEIYDGAVDIEECTFTGNFRSALYDSTVEGGALALIYATATVSDSEFTENNASSYESLTSGYGGAIYARNSEIAVTNTTFSRNESDGDEHFYAHSEGPGGAIYAVDSGLSLDGCAFAENEAYDDGGAIYAEDSDVTAVSCAFTDNGQSFGLDPPSGRGGTFHIDGGTLTIEGSSVSGGWSYGEGGALYMADATVIVRDSALSGCEADGWGGAISAASGDLTVEGSSLTDSFADYRGGAIYLAGGTALLEGSEIAGSETYERGGALYVAGDLEMIDTAVFRGFGLHYPGGGAYVAGGSLAVTNGDWGTGSDDNAPDDVYTATAGVSYTGYGAGVSFTCTASGCL